MKRIVLASCLLLAPVLVQADDDVWRWQDESGTVHYSNVAQRVPAEATVVETRIVVEAARMPSDDPGARSAVVLEGVPVAPPARQLARGPFRPLPDPPQIYTPERRRFGCFTGGILSSGGFAQPDDIAVAYNCLPYMLGPRAWLNTAKAELAVRANGINPQQILQMYNQQYEVYGTGPR